MRDDRSKWHPASSVFERLETETLTVVPCDVGRQYLMSGTTVAVQGNVPIGWPDIARSNNYSLRTRRDQIVHVGGDRQATGWDSGCGCAVTDFSDGYGVFEISGSSSFSLLCRGAELDLAMPSRSVVRRMWGMDVLLYRHTEETRFRLHVERCLAPALYQTFDHLISTVF